MKKYLEQRIISVGKHIAETGCTVRTTAKVFSLSKSTVHNDMLKKLPIIEPTLGREVSCILKQHKDTRHILGGLATKAKYTGLKRDNK